MVTGRQLKRWWRRTIYFFPLQLLVLHLKKNHLLLLFWLVLWGYITGELGVKYGIPYLFLYPEYLGHVTFWSFLITGFALGGFITAFNLYSYTMHGYRFAFIATLSRPFLKFNLNNAIIPAAFVLTYLYCSARLQLTKELLDASTVALNLFGFLLGIILFQLISLLYFTRTNTDITKMIGRRTEEYRPTGPPADMMGPDRPIPRVRAELRKATRWLRREQRAKKWQVETYLVPPFRIVLARSSQHYDKVLLRSVLWQNHINGSIFEVLVIVSFIALGAINVDAFEIPTGASAFLLFTMLLMIISAMYSWFKGWTFTVVLVAIVAVNWISHETDSFLYNNQAYGLDYKAPPARYDRENLARMASDTAVIEKDQRTMEAVLDRWYDRNAPLNGNGKPPLIIVSTSGGGLRAMLWTFRCLQYADSLMGGTLMQRTAMITGSSGGAIGATYYRQLDWNALKGRGGDTQDPVHLDHMSKDILNPVTFTFVTNDMFIRYKRVRDGDLLYTRDRGYVFEERLNEITENVLDVRLGDLTLPEMAAEMPFLILAPTSINDGRRLVISALPVSHLTNTTPERSTTHVPEPESMEFRRMFANQGADNLKLTSALRMGATFPYITPVVTLPSEPAMRVMDAGIRDNYGFHTMSSFLMEHREWIKEHAGRVVVLQMRDKQKDLEIQDIGRSLLGRLFDPASNVYGNFLRLQDQDYDLTFQQISVWSGVPLEVIDLQLRHDMKDEISLSWHLTTVEKNQILATINSEENQRSFARLLELAPRTNTLLSEKNGQQQANSGR